MPKTKRDLPTLLAELDSVIAEARRGMADLREQEQRAVALKRALLADSAHASPRVVASVLTPAARRALELIGSSYVLDRCTPKHVCSELAGYGLTARGVFGLSERGRAVSQIVQDEQLDRLGL